ncbi:MAG: hypothetical protein LQ350_001957 [Teloschistes chrysophthalmus]|nr:MAG: hypothetical protein LQ350_001957 [Niorma chrysophthalma]
MPQFVARAPRTFKNRKSFGETRFGKLPFEIRANIYGLALKVEVPLWEVNRPYFTPRHHTAGGYKKKGLVYTKPGETLKTRPSKWLGLLLVCRQMHQEAVHVWYAVNYIKFTSSKDFVNMCNSVPNKFRFLKHVRIESVLHDWQPINLMHALAECTDLTELTLLIMKGDRRYAQDKDWLAACGQPRVMEAVEKVRGLRSVEFLSVDKYRDKASKEYIGPVERRLQAPIWKPLHLEIAQKMTELMMRPKLVTGEGEAKREKETSVVDEEEEPAPKRVCI